MKKTLFLIFVFLVLFAGIFLVVLYGKKIAALFNHPLPPDEIFLAQKAEQLKREHQKASPRQSFCENGFLPFVPGANWSYAVFSEEQKDSLKLSVAEPINEISYLDGELASDSWIFRHQITCTSEGIVMEYFNFANPFKKIHVYTTPQKTEGIFLKNLSDPREVSFWKLMTTNKNETFNQEEQTIDSRHLEESDISFQAVGMEEVNVPLGTFPSLHVHSSWIIKETEIEAESKTENQPDKNRKATWDFWLVDQIGIAKSIYQEDGAPQVRLELRGFQIPAPQTISENTGEKSDSAIEQAERLNLPAD